jgi:SAM-dependent methyltransferase
MMQIEPLEGFDWQHWVGRWDRMQEGYLVRRGERFATVIRLVRDTQGPAPRVLDLGCGPGSLMCALLQALPRAEMLGIDFDPTMLLLGRRRLTRYGGRASFALADLRQDAWLEAVPGPVDAVVSATALHWLRADELTTLYRQVSTVLRPGGVFVNADHIGSDCAAIQEGWVRHRQGMREREGNGEAEDWDGFWEAYAKALGVDVGEVHERMLGGWEGGVEDGLPLAWQLDALRACGFHSVDCFWRCDCDAIYGGMRGDEV